MSRKKDDLGAALHTLALKVVEEANKDDVKLDVRLDALKIASAHYVATVKAKAKEDDGDEGTDFRSFKAKIEAAEGNVTPIKGSR